MKKLLVIVGIIFVSLVFGIITTLRIHRQLDSYIADPDRIVISDTGQIIE